MPKPICAAVLIGFALITPKIHAQSQSPVGTTASLKDTLAWMHNFAADRSKQFKGQSSFDNQPCELGKPDCQQRIDATPFDYEPSRPCSVVVKWSVSFGLKENGTTTYHFSLADLDPNSVIVIKDPPFDISVEAETRNSEKKVTTTGFLNDTEKETWVGLVFGGGDDAKRFANAFKHAIQLCGGKPSVF